MKISLSIREFRPPFHCVFRVQGLGFRADNEPRRWKAPAGCVAELASAFVCASQRRVQGL
jgi:hypothetical protein